MIIGGTGGIGLSAGLSFIKAGARVVAVGSSEETCMKARKKLGSEGLVVRADAREAHVAEEAIEHCMEHFGGFHGLYHVAGGSGRSWGDGPLHEITLEGWNKTLELNLTSLMLSNRAAVSRFLKDGTKGAILNMSSVLAYSPSPRYFATHTYAAAKSAVIGFSRSIAAYYASRKIRINVIVPALVETPMSDRAREDRQIMDFIRTKQPLDGGRIGKPEDLDGLACYFMSDKSTFTTGQVIAVDGGWDLSEGQHKNKEGSG